MCVAEGHCDHLDEDFLQIRIKRSHPDIAVLHRDGVECCRRALRPGERLKWEGRS